MTSESAHRRAWVCAALLGASWSSHFETGLACELARNTCCAIALDPTESIRESALEVLTGHAGREARLTTEGAILLAEHAERTWAAIQAQGDLVDRLYEEMHTG